MKMKVNEIFCSIQGEGIMVGTPMNFIRFCRCNLECNYCDTDFKEGVEMEIPKMIEKLDERFGWVSLTGGEPMLEENLRELIHGLREKGFNALLETNGTLFDKSVFDACDFLSVDMKGPASGNPGYDGTVLDYCMENPKRSQLKVVIKGREDLEFFQRIYDGEYPNWVLQPEWDSMEKIDYGLIMNGINDNVRVIPQIHKIMQVR